VPVLVVLVLVVAAATLGMQVGPGVRASFTSGTTRTTGTLSFASLTSSFAGGTDDLGAVGGVGGATYTLTVSLTLTGTATHRYTTLTNTSSVPAALAGAVTGSVPVGTMTVAVDRCSIPWAATLCTGATSVRAATALSPAPSVSYGSLAVGGLLYLRYTFTATSTPAPPRPWGTPTGGPILHRIVALTHSPDGHPQIRTKGDANKAMDPWTIDASRGAFARLRGSSVLAGRLLAMLRHTTSGPALALWPGLVLLGLALRHSNRQRTAPSRARPTPSRRYQPRHAAAR
jgi:hypothetical protein